MNASPNHEVAVFAEAARLSPGERVAFLERACGGDAILRQRVEALLKVHEHVGDFMEESSTNAGMVAHLAAATSEKPGDRIGRYKLLEKIGEGGCGVVYMADQEEPVRRRVALKIIKPGMDTKSVIARFEAERQALALMDHPGIAKVLDAGATDSGRPFFVMELVRGMKITDYCDQNSLSTEARLALFAQVCHAVQHAHQKGIIHRDLKPSNILVTTNLEGVPVPIVIDFGIAKATTDQRLTDKTLFTAFEMLIGTPAYMSPEQAALTSVDVDTRTDIYSLGVLLYELLTGAPPFDTGELLKVGLDEVRRVIREQEPLRPSTRLSKMTDEMLTSIAHQRRAEPPALVRTVRGDLDWIAMRALEKDRTRRYDTANGLALDVERYLANEAISARPPSRLYRLQKTVARNRVLFAGVAIVLLLLIVSLIVLSASLAHERQARRDADTARQQTDAARKQAEVDKAKAVAEAAKSQQVTQFLEDLLKGVGPSVALGRDTQMLREILDKAAARIDTELNTQPAVAAELRTEIGSVYAQLGVYDQAEAMHRAALASYRKLFGNEAKEVAVSLNALTPALARQGKFPEAEAAVREALAINRKVFGPEHPVVITTMARLVAVLVTDGREAEAEPLDRAILAIRRKLLGNDHMDVAKSLGGLGVNLSNQEKFAEGEAFQREAVAICRKHLPPEHPDLAVAINNLSWTLSHVGKLDEAEALAREALAIRRKLFTTENRVVADSLYILCEALRTEKKLAEAEAAIREAVAIDRRILGAEHHTTLGFLQLLAHVLEDQGKFADAEGLFRDSLQGRRKTQGSSHIDVGLVLADLGEALFRQGKLAESESTYRESLVILRKAAGPKSPIVASDLAGLGAVLFKAGNSVEAEALAREATTIDQQAFGEGDPQRTRALGLLRDALLAQGKAAEAEAVRSELETAKTRMPAAVTKSDSKPPRNE